MLTLRTGLVGSSKTLLQTLAVYPLLLKGRKVYSNYWINYNGPNLFYYKDLSELTHVRNAIILIDEVTIVLDPRGWEYEPKEVREMFILHRHRHLDIRATTQHPSMVAKTVKTQITHWYHIVSIMSCKWFVWSRVAEIPRTELTSDEPVMPKGFGSVIQGLRFMLVKQDIVCPKLDKFKLELQHAYCKEEALTFHDLDVDNLPVCPSCGGPLILRHSGLYDTDYELPEKDLSDIVIKKFRRIKVDKLVDF